MASFKRKHRLRQADPDSDPKQSQSALEQQEDGFLDKATCQPMQLAKALSKQKMKIKPANEILTYKKDLLVQQQVPASQKVLPDEKHDFKSLSDMFS